MWQPTLFLSSRELQTSRLAIGTTPTGFPPSKRSGQRATESDGPVEGPTPMKRTAATPRQSLSRAGGPQTLDRRRRHVPEQPHGHRKHPEVYRTGIRVRDQGVTKRISPPFRTWGGRHDLQGHTGEIEIKRERFYIFVFFSVRAS